MSGELEYDDFDPEEFGQIESLIAMTDYLLPQARCVSALAAFYLGMARHELFVAGALRDEVVAPIRPPN